MSPEQTAVFGDYLNDLELYDRAELSFAMANAHPRVLARARYIAPANDEGGVTRNPNRIPSSVLSGRGRSWMFRR